MDCIISETIFSKDPFNFLQSQLDIVYRNDSLII